MRLIDADDLRIDFKNRVKACDKWIEECAGEELKQARAIATKDFISEVIMTIDNAPTIERPHGEWIFTGRHNVYGGAEIECSNCHNKLMVSPSRWEIGENFCDVCGSRNKKEGEKNESDHL